MNVLRYIEPSLARLYGLRIPHTRISPVREVDKLVLWTLNRTLPPSFDRSYRHTLPFEDVLARTEVRLPLIPEMGLLEARTYRFHLQTLVGRLPVKIRVLPSAQPDAPVIVYQHGFNIIPYDRRACAIFSADAQFDAHIVLLQFPFHRWPHEPIRHMFASLHHLYTAFAGSIRLMEMVHNHYAALGAPYTVAIGTSMGGVTAVLYEALFQQTQAVIPLFSSPNISQLLWDVGLMLQRPITVPKRLLFEYLDFTPHFRRIDPAKIYPLLGAQDMFFRYDHHASVYTDCRVQRAGDSHLSGMVNLTASREHILATLERIRAIATGK